MRLSGFLQIVPGLMEKTVHFYHIYQQKISCTVRYSLVSLESVETGQAMDFHNTHSKVIQFLWSWGSELQIPVTVPIYVFQNAP